MSFAYIFLPKLKKYDTVSVTKIKKFDSEKFNENSVKDKSKPYDVTLSDGKSTKCQVIRVGGKDNKV